MQPYVGYPRAIWDLCHGKLAGHRSRPKAKDEKRRLEKSGRTRVRRIAKLMIVSDLANHQREVNDGKS